MSSKPTHRAAGMTQFTFQLPEELKARLKERASTERRSLGNLIILLLEEGLASDSLIPSHPPAANDQASYGAPPQVELVAKKKPARKKKA